MFEDKKLALFERLIIDAGHQDLSFVEDLTRGFDLTGKLPTSGLLWQSLSSSQDLLREFEVTSYLGRLASWQFRTAIWTRAFGRQPSTKSKKILEGRPSASDFPENALLTKRFSVKPNNEIHLIDDYKANMGNRSVTQSEGVTERCLHV